jgi:hypothetical protein
MRTEESEYSFSRVQANSYIVYPAKELQVQKLLEGIEKNTIYSSVIDP